MMRLVFFICFMMLYPYSDTWELKKSGSGIEVFTRSIDGSAFKEFKGVTIVEKSSLNQVLEVILDVSNYESLFPDCINPRVLEQFDHLHVIQYVQTKTPFPVKNRDSIIELKAETDRNGKHVHIYLNALPDYIAENKDFVRLRKGTGYWDLEEDNAGNVKVVYQFHGEPGGDIPAWIANSFLVNHPFKTLENLKERVK